MPFSIGSTAAKKVFFGTTEIKKIFSGTTQVWSSASYIYLGIANTILFFNKDTLAFVKEETYFTDTKTYAQEEDYEFNSDADYIYLTNKRTKQYNIGYKTYKVSKSGDLVLTHSTSTQTEGKTSIFLYNNYIVSWNSSNLLLRLHNKSDLAPTATTGVSANLGGYFTGWFETGSYIYRYYSSNFYDPEWDTYYSYVEMKRLSKTSIGTAVYNVLPGTLDDVIGNRKNDFYSDNTNIYVMYRVGTDDPYNRIGIRKLNMNGGLVASSSTAMYSGYSMAIAGDATHVYALLRVYTDYGYRLKVRKYLKSNLSTVATSSETTYESLYEEGSQPPRTYRATPAYSLIDDTYVYFFLQEIGDDSSGRRSLFILRFRKSDLQKTEARYTHPTTSIELKNIFL